jgi:hypothetical protein
MRSITVYCSSSTHLDPDFHEPARQVGAEIARRGLTLIYGGGSIGLMGEVADAAQGAGGKVIGIITEYLMAREQGRENCDELVIVKTMRQRKQQMAERGDGFLILPGGLGTYEEFFEILVGRVLREHDKPIGIVNSHGYYNPMIAMVEHGIEHRFIQRAIYDMLCIDPNPITVISQLCDSTDRATVDNPQALMIGKPRA